MSRSRPAPFTSMRTIFSSGVSLVRAGVGVSANIVASMVGLHDWADLHATTSAHH